MSELRKAAERVMEAHKSRGLDVEDYTLKVLEAALSNQPEPVACKNCQNGDASVCAMAKHDGIVCPEDSCDIDDSIRHLPLNTSPPTVSLSDDALLKWYYNYKETNNNDVEKEGTQALAFLRAFEVMLRRGK